MMGSFSLYSLDSNMLYLGIDRTLEFLNELDFNIDNHEYVYMLLMIEIQRSVNLIVPCK